MDNNNYQPQFQQPQFEQQPTYQQPVYQQPPQPDFLPPDIQQMVDSVFGKALAATIMCEFPIASIIAIFFGNNALKEIITLMDICKSMGIRLPGKLIAGRILALVGKISGIVCTCIYGGLAVFYTFYFFLFFVMAMSAGF